ncbi:MAG: TRAP transporter large permease subunit [Chloroflexota bacterium]
MEWWVLLPLILGILVIIMLTGLPVAFCFLVLCTIGAFFVWRGDVGLLQVIFGIKESIAKFILLPVPLFVLMGAVMFHSGIAPNMLNALNKWLGRLPGRLGLLAVLGGTIFATLSGSSSASVALLGATLVPEMEKQGYKKPLTLGPILGSGGLAIMIPPSGIAVFLAIVAEIPIGKFLIAIILPGLLMAILYAAYIIIRSWLQPSLAPAYDVAHIPLSEKLLAAVKYILPLALIIFSVLGVMLLGIATPSQAAATGALATVVLAAAYKKLTWPVIKKALISTVEISVMIFMIIATAKVYSQILATTGASRGMIQFATSLPLAPIILIVGMQVVVIILGMFMPLGGITMICLPLFVPVVKTLGFDPVWFVVMFLLAVEMGYTTPPFGVNLFIMKGVAPPDSTFGDMVRAALPFLYCDAVALILVLVFPQIALWLPSLMQG